MQAIISIVQILQHCSDFTTLCIFYKYVHILHILKGIKPEELSIVSQKHNMSKFTDQKSTFLSTASVSGMVRQMKAGGVEVGKPTKAGRPWNAKFRGGPKNVNVMSPPRSQKENIQRSEERHGVVVWDVMIGNSEAQDDPIEKRRETAAKASFSVSVLEDTPLFKSLTGYNDAIVRCAVELLVESAEGPFKGNEDVDELVKKTKFIIRKKEDSKYPPNMDLVVKPGPNDKKFTAGFVTEGFDEDGNLLIQEQPTFSWDNMEKFIKKGSIVHKIKGSTEYASVFFRNGCIDSINLQFQVSRINLSLPIEAKDAYDSDEVIMPRSPKRARLEKSESCAKLEEDEKAEEAASEGDAQSESE